MRREPYREPGFYRAGAQAALFPTAAVHLARLWAAGSIGVYRGTERHWTERRWTEQGRANRRRNALGQSSDRGQQTAGNFRGAAACGAEIVSARGADAFHAGRATRRRAPRAGAGPRHRRRHPPARAKRESPSHGETVLITAVVTSPEAPRKSLIRLLFYKCLHGEGASHLLVGESCERCENKR